MNRHEELYDLLLDYAKLDTEVEQILVGWNWTLCRAGSVGMAVTRPQSELGEGLPLKGRPLAELALWLRKWDHHQASIGLAAVNCAINREADMVYREGGLFKGRLALQAGFDWFRPLLKGKRVVVAGKGAGYFKVGSVTPLELPAAIPPHAPHLLRKAEWVFLPAETVADKTLPRLLELSEDATVVLYGAETPWLDEWREFGVDYLIGSQIDDADLLATLIAEGNGAQSLSEALSWRVIDLSRAQTAVQQQSRKSLKLA
jgi:uncharacterized protein (DUF4213/DUF364 family)